MICLLAVSLPGHPCSAQDDFFSQATFEYELFREKTMLPVAELDDFYRKKLTELRKEAVTSGKLDYVIELDATMESIDSDVPIAAEQKFEKLRHFHSVYLKNRESRLAEISDALDKLAREYERTIEERIAELTRAEKIDEAIALRKMLESGKLKTVEAAKSRPVLNLENGGFCGVAFGAPEDELIKALEDNGLKVNPASPMSAGGKNYSVSSFGMNFRVDGKGIYHEIYVLGAQAPIQDKIAVKTSRVEDVEEVLDKKAKRDKSSESTGKYTIETKKTEILLLTETPDDPIIKGLMVKAR